MANYVFLSVAALGISFLIFSAFLKREKNFNFKRGYLLGSLLLCLLFPTLEIDWGGSALPVKPLPVKQVFSGEDFSEELQGRTVAVYEQSGVQLQQELWMLYSFVSILLFLRFIINLLKIARQVKAGNLRQLGELTLVEKQEKGNPFSFFKYLFIHPDDLEDAGWRDSIIKHERQHSKELHSVDIVLVELLSCLFWFNPFLWLYKKEIAENHEFLADAAVLKSGIDADQYCLQLIKSGDKTQPSILSGFSFINTRNRLNMMYKNRSSSSFLFLKNGIALLLLSLTLTLSSWVPSGESNPFVVVVDAGHGGKDAGPFNEKVINFEIAQKLQLLGDNKEVKIIPVRSGDDFLSLKQRLEFVEKQKPDLLLSLHTNTSDDPGKTGVEAFYAPMNISSEKSLKYSKILISHQVKEAAATGEIKAANFRILLEAKTPAVLLELGYLSNVAEAQKLREPDHQKKIASAIYAALQEIKALEKK